MSSLEALAALCAVAFYGNGRYLGSGFFVAPGEVLTCAHVVANQDAATLSVHCAGSQLTVPSAPLLLPPEHGPDSTYAFPDLALVRLSGAGQPCALLGDTGPGVASQVLCLGFSKHAPGGAQAAKPEPVLVEVAGSGGADLIRVQHGEIPDGLSGGLVLDLDTRRVCGMVKATRDPSAERGGWIIPVPAILDRLPGLAARNLQVHPAGSAWRDLASRRVELTTDIFRSRAPMEVTRRTDPPPSWWLDPRHRATTYQDRPELTDLESWAMSDAPEVPSVRLVTGPGGSGKTRLAVELAVRLEAQGWIAGLLTPDDADRLVLIADALQSALDRGHQVFVAIDYAEGLGSALSRFLARLPGAELGKVRILLLARFGGWLTAAMPSGAAKYVIDQVPVELGPLSATPQAATNCFADAVRDYRTELSGPSGKAPDTPLPPELLAVAGRQTSALRCHALALASALLERGTGNLPRHEVAWTDPLDLLVAHERKHFLQACQGSVADSEHHQYVPEGRALVVPTMVPAYNADQAAAAIGRMPGVEDYFTADPAGIAAILRSLYPPDTATSLRWWSALPLDRLGETLLAQVLAAAPGDMQAAELVLTALAGLDVQHAIQGLAVLARVFADSDNQALTDRAEHCLRTVAAADAHRLFPALLAADRLVPPGQRISDVLVGELDAYEAMDIAQHVSAVTSAAPAILEAGLLLIDRAARLLDADDSWIGQLPEGLRELCAQGARPVQSARVAVDIFRARLLARLDRSEEAAGLAARATEQIRACWEAELAGGGLALRGTWLSVPRAGGPAAGSYAGIFLLALDVQADVLGHLNRLQEAAQLHLEAIGVADQLPERAADAVRHRYELAQALYELDQNAEAERVLGRAEELVGDLDEPDWQTAIRILRALTLGRLGRADEASALAATIIWQEREAAGCSGDYRQLAEAGRKLALLLNDQHSLDALAELRASALSDPSAAMPAFALQAIETGLSLASRGQREAGESLAREGLRQLRRLASDDPARYLLLLAGSLCRCVGESLLPDPHAAMAEAIAIYKTAAERTGLTSVRVDLALAKMRDAVLWRDEDEPAVAIGILSEAIERLRPEMSGNPWRTAAYLSTALILRSETDRVHGDRDRAAVDAREALTIEVARTDDLAPTPADHLPSVRLTLMKALVTSAGRRDDAGMAAALAEAQAIGQEIPVAALDDLNVFFVGNVGASGFEPGDKAALPDAIRSWRRTVQELRARADRPGASPSAQPLLAADIALVQLLLSADRTAEATDEMVALLADCRRQLPGGIEERVAALTLMTEVISESTDVAAIAGNLRVLAAQLEALRESPELPPNRLSLLAGFLPMAAGQMHAASGQGVSDDVILAAAFEIDASIRALEEQRPELLTLEHAQALGSTAGYRARSSQAEAMAVGARAIRLYERLAPAAELATSLSFATVLVFQGVLQVKATEPQAAVGSLERALDIILTSWRADTPRAHGLLRSLGPTLAATYQALGQEAAINAVRARLADSGVLDSHADWVAHQQRPRPPDRVEELREAIRALAGDPDRAAERVRSIMEQAVRDDDFVLAWQACEVLSDEARHRGRADELVTLADRRIAYGRRANAGPWTYLYGQIRRFVDRDQRGLAGPDELTAVAELRARADALPYDSGEPELIEVWWVREHLLRLSVAVAARAGQWADVVTFSQAEAASIRDRGAPAADAASAELNAVNGLIRLGQLDAAAKLLHRCADVLADATDGRRELARILEARASIDAARGHQARAIETSAQALAALYAGDDAGAIQRAHEVHAALRAQADLRDEYALAHDLAAATLAILLGMPVDLRRIVLELVARGGHAPRTARELASAIDEAPGLRFGALADSCAADESALAIAFDGILRKARTEGRDLLAEFARHQIRWDPVFAGVVVARQGNFAAAQAVRALLASYKSDADWSDLARAVTLVFLQRDAEVESASLVGVDIFLFRRCLDAVQGTITIPTDLVHAIPLVAALPVYLFAVQTGSPGSHTARLIQTLADSESYSQLAAPLRAILGGSRSRTLTEGLSTGNAAIVSELLELLALTTDQAG